MPGSTPSRVEIDNLGIPPLAGICSYAAAASRDCRSSKPSSALKRCNYVLRRLHDVGVAHLAATPEWEVKCGLGLHVWLDAEHASALQARIGEMREPPLGLDTVPDERLEAAFEELIRAGSRSSSSQARTRGSARPGHRLPPTISSCSTCSSITLHVGCCAPSSMSRRRCSAGASGARRPRLGDGPSSGGPFATHVVALPRGRRRSLGSRCGPGRQRAARAALDGPPFEMDPAPSRSPIRRCVQRDGKDRRVLARRVEAGR